MNEPKRLPNAERKLDAAIFFLQRLQEAQEDPRAFYHYVTALLSTARSVDYALRHEAGDRYLSWLDAWLAGLTNDEQALARELIGFRNADIHADGVPVWLTMDISTIFTSTQIAGVTGTGLKRVDLARVWERLPHK